MRQSRFIALQPGTVFHGRYCVLGSIKAGGMGAVYQVLDAKTDTRRALKVLLPELIESVDVRARFTLEATICGSIQSEHLVHVTDAGIDEETGVPFLVMELLRGEDLASMISRREGIPHSEVIVYLFQAALALEKTHAANIVHRDLKPENLFVTYRDDGSPCVKILDFGIAKIVAQSSQPHTTRSVGTPMYMAPEQVHGKAAVGPLTDIYGFGQLAFSLLVGRPYWSEEYGAEALLPFFSKVVRGVREPATRRAARLGVALPPTFDGWFCRATAPRPQDRFARALDAVAALAEALAVPLPALSRMPPPIDPSAGGLTMSPAALSSLREGAACSGRHERPRAERARTDEHDASSPATIDRTKSRRTPRRMHRPPPARLWLLVATVLCASALLVTLRHEGSEASSTAVGGAAPSALQSLPPSAEGSPAVATSVDIVDIDGPSRPSGSSAERPVPDASASSSATRVPPAPGPSVAKASPRGGPAPGREKSRSSRIARYPPFCRLGECP